MREIQFANTTNNLITFASKWRKKLVPDEVQAGKNLARQMSGTKDKYQFDKKIEELSDKSFNSKMDKRIYSNKYPKTKNSYIQISSTGKSSLNSHGKTRLGYAKESLATRKQIASNVKAKAEEIKKVVSRRKIGKIGLALAGGAVVGGLGYGLVRKIRSDKGKKRR